MPAPRPRHARATPAPLQSQTWPIARAMPAPRPRQCPVPPGPPASGERHRDVPEGGHRAVGQTRAQEHFTRKASFSVRLRPGGSCVLSLPRVRPLARISGTIYPLSCLTRGELSGVEEPFPPRRPASTASALSCVTEGWTRPGRIRSLKFYRVGRVRDASAAVSPWRGLGGSPATAFPAISDRDRALRA
eukprot:gene6907-biopygen5982